VRKVLFALAVFATSLPTLARADDYQVSVTRIDQDLYKTDTNIYIKTQFCYEFATGDDAILVYDGLPGSFDNKIIFTQDNQVCRVTGVFQ
jgi:hypothetical protein